MYSAQLNTYLPSVLFYMLTALILSTVLQYSIYIERTDVERNKSTNVRVILHRYSVGSVLSCLLVRTRKQTKHGQKKYAHKLSRDAGSEEVAGRGHRTASTQKFPFIEENSVDLKVFFGQVYFLGLFLKIEYTVAFATKLSC